MLVDIIVSDLLDLLLKLLSNVTDDPHGKVVELINARKAAAEIDKEIDEKLHDNSTLP